MSSDTLLYQGTFELEFERPLTQLEKQIAELEAQASQATFDMAPELEKLRDNHQTLLEKIYANLSGWQTVQVARHPGRPQTTDYLRSFVKEWCELHGDRRFSDDPALVTGFGRIGPHKCMVIGHCKGKDTKDRVRCNFGMAHPEGYRKALLKMKMAEKFGLPVVTLIDTPGAWPGVGAEDRGQAEAIAVNLLEMSRLRTPIISVVIGEGASGGALGIGVADRVAMLQYAWYSVISPEGCAGILWKQATPQTNAQAAEALRLTARENLKLGVVDEVIEEPRGGAHREPGGMADRLEKWLIGALRDLKRFKTDNLVQRRSKKWREVGVTSGV